MASPSYLMITNYLLPPVISRKILQSSRLSKVKDAGIDTRHDKSFPAVNDSLLL